MFYLYWAAMRPRIQLPSDWLNQPLSAIATLSPIQELSYPPWRSAGIRVSVKREDLLHEQLGGNKLYKLWGHLQAARQWAKDKHQDTYVLASFGGAYSNHLYALAAAGEQLGLSTIGFVRGERPARLSPTLHDCLNMGMNLHFLSRTEYASKNDMAMLDRLAAEIGIEKRVFWIPEGGGGVLGMTGCRVLAHGMVQQSVVKPDILAVAVGTGTTLAGLSLGLPASITAFGVSVIKGGESLLPQIHDLVRCYEHDAPSPVLCCDFHAGGYARLSSELREFIKHFEQHTQLMLDPVYTAKLFWAITQLARQGAWRPGTHILALHSGGIQGRRGFDIQGGSD